MHKTTEFDSMKHFSNVKNGYQETTNPFETKKSKNHVSNTKDLLKEYVRSQQYTSTSDNMQAMKEIFRDVIEQVMEVEMDDELGQE